MTFNATVKECISNFFEAKLPFKISLVSLVLTIIFQIVCLSINDWTVSDSQKEGLWNRCSIKGNVTCCTPIDDAPAELNVTRAFLISTVSICLPVMIILRCIQMKEDNVDNMTLQQVYLHFAVFSVMFQLMASVIYITTYDDWSMQDGKLSVGYGLCLIGIFLLPFEWLVVCLGIKGRRC